MSSRSFRSLWVRFSFFFSLTFILIVSSIAVPRAAAQTTQHFFSPVPTTPATIPLDLRLCFATASPALSRCSRTPSFPSRIPAILQRSIPPAIFCLVFVEKAWRCTRWTPPPESSPKLPPRLTPPRSPPARAASWLPPKAPASMFDRRNLRWAQAHAA